MRWIFYSLLLANLFYLGLNLWNDRTDEARVVTAGPGADSGTKVDRLLFLSESAGSSQKRDAKLGQAKLVEASADLASCMGLGPFEDIISAQDVAERLKATGYAVEMTAVDTPTGDSDFRVVLPPFNSLQEAFRRLRELKSRNIDSYVITQGENAQGISLGVFSTIGAAEDYQKELSDLGYKVVIKVIPRVNRGYWVQIGQNAFPGTLVAGVTAEFSGVGVTETACMN